MLNKKKRGQITLFIIIGLIILMGVFGVIYISSLQKEKIETAAERLASIQIPNWAEPINEYVKQCIQTVALKGFKNCVYPRYINGCDR